MSKRDVKVKMKLPGVNKVLRSAQPSVNAAAARVAADAGPKFQVKPSPHRYTARAFAEPKPGERLSDEDRLALLTAVANRSS